MVNLFKSSLYKLFKEKTFLITFIIGTVLAIVIPLLLHFVLKEVSDSTGGAISAGGELSLINSVSLGNNFGLTVPINLAVVTIAEFTTGTIRNKIIAGYRKSSIYLSLLFSGLVFTILLMGYYIALNVLMGTLLDGFDASKIGGASFILPYFAITLCCFIFVTTFSIFISTTFRNLGATIPVIVLFLVFLSIVSSFMDLSGNETAINVMRWVDPLYVMNQYSATGVLLGFDTSNFNDYIAPGIISPLAYSALFIGFGMFEFSKRDIK